MSNLMLSIQVPCDHQSVLYEVYFFMELRFECKNIMLYFSYRKKNPESNFFTMLFK